MNKIELFKMAFTNLFRRKARSILAILGVIIGTASIITMVSIGLGMTKNFNDAIQKAPGLHLIDIFGISNRNANEKSSLKMDDNAIKYLKSIEGVSYVTPVKNKHMRVIIGNYVADTNIIGLDLEFLKKAHVNISKGRDIKSGEKFKLIFGSQTPNMFSNYKTGEYIEYSRTGNYNLNLINPKIELTNNTEYKKPKIERHFRSDMERNGKEAPKYEVFKSEGVGVIKDDGEYGYSIYTNLETLDLIDKSNSKAESLAGQKPFKGEDEKNKYSQMMIYVEDINDVGNISDKLKEDGFQFYSIMNEVKQEQKKFAMIQASLGGIGAVSLLVAAIGIANTMIMSIYERRREIGVMKVIGASLKDIKRLFLYEAASIGLLGGLIGSLLSIVISFAVNFFYVKFTMQGGDMMGGMYYYPPEPGMEQIKPFISYMPIWLIAFGIIFSTIIGIVSGYLPARKAMSLSALESLRTE